MDRATCSLFGRTLRQLRTEANFSQRRLAVQVPVSQASLSRYESGDQAADETMAARLDELLDTGGELARLVAEAAAKRASDSAGPGIVPRRTVLGVAAGAVVGGALGALELASPGGVVDVKPASFFAAALQTLAESDNLFGPRDVIPRVESQIAAIGHAWANARGADRAELIHIRSNFAEFCAWLYQDLGDHAAARHWADRALDWSYLSDDRELTVYVLTRKSQLACDMGDHHTATGMGHVAAAAAPHVKLAAIASTYAAHGYALGGDGANADRNYDAAREFVDRSDGACQWGVWLDNSYIEVHQAQSLNELGQHERAAHAFDHALSVLPGGYYRDRGVYLARAARAYAGAGDVDHAATLGIKSLTIASDTQSGRTASELLRLSNELRPAHTAGVDEFQHVLRRCVPTARR